MTTGRRLCRAWSLAILAVLAVPGLLLAQQAPPAPSVWPSRIPLIEFKKLVDADAVLVIDVRDAESYASGHIPGALLVPLEDLEKQVPRLKASKKPIVAYCA
jgi:predicted sulfurtransferase